MSLPEKLSDNLGTRFENLASSCLPSAMHFQLVQQDPDVCNNCFRRTHQRFERNYAKRLRYIPGRDEYEIWWDEVDLPDDVIAYDKETDYLRLEPAARGTRVICVCGFYDDEKLRPLPKDLFLEYGENLYERYVEMGAPVMKERFLGVLKNMKEQPENQFADDRMFQEATERVSKDAVRVHASD